MQYTGKPPAQCSSPPNSPNATAANRNRFITLWAPRLANKAWFEKFVQESTVPQNILAEGFNSMDQPTQAWLVACLVQSVLAADGQHATQSQIGGYQLSLDLVIFDKAGLAAARKRLSSTTPVIKPTPKPPAGLSVGVMKGAITRLAHGPGVTAAALPKIKSALPTVATRAFRPGTAASARLRSLDAAVANTRSVPQDATPWYSRASTTSVLSTQAATGPTVRSVDPNSVFNTVRPALTIPTIPQLLNALNALEQIVANIEQTLFTVPPLNIVGALFYRVCAESPTMTLRCSILLPLGVPIPADVTGDNIPDVLCELLPYVGTTSADVYLHFSVTRLHTTGALPAHVFFVYDVPFIKKRVEYGYDGRASTLANQSITVFTLHNAYKALTGDIDVSASVTNKVPGSTEALTFAVKDLVGGSAGHPPTEANPLAGAVQFTPFPYKLTMEAHLTHAGSGGQDEDVFTVHSSTPSVVNAVMNQDTTTTTPQSHRQFTALINKLPTSVVVDLVHHGSTQTITYTASAAIAHVQASDTDTPDISQPGSYTQSIYNVVGVPTSVKVTLDSSSPTAQDVRYAASSKVTQVSFTTQTYSNSQLQQEITAQAQSIPTSVHFNMNTGPDVSTYTYNSNAVLPKVMFSMYNRSEDQTNLVATVTSIPTSIQFTQTKSTGTYNFSANNPIGQIQADLSRGGGSVLALSGVDHATVYKRGSGLGAEVQLSGFQAAYFDGSQKTTLSMVLNPGGQAFQAIADLDSPNVLASAHVSALPGSMAVTIDSVGGSATYSASSIIPELDGAFTQRDTGTTANFTLNNLPKNITATWAISGSAPRVTYSADSQLGKIQGFYQQSLGGLSFQTTISSLPKYMSISGTAPIVFDARTSAGAASGSGSIGSILFDYATDGTFATAPTTDDHLLLQTTGGQTHAEVLYHGLAYLNADTTGGALHAELRNSAPRLVRAYLTTPDLTMTGFINSVPADVKIGMVGNDIQYHASSTISEIFTQLTRANGDSVNVDVTGIPASIDLTLDAANSQVVWSSSSPVTGISVNAHLTAATLGTPTAFDAGLTITGIPTAWSVSYGNGNINFTTNGTGIGQINADVTNHGTFHTLPGDHLSAFYDQPSGQLDASLQVSNLRSILYKKITDNSGGGFSAGLNMGTGGSLGLSAQINLGSNSLTATGSFSHLPSVISLVDDGGHITYSGNNNPTLNLSVAAGDNAAIAATPSPNNVNGISVRDGKSGTGIAVKANISLTGLPDGLDFNTVTGIYKVTNFAPSVDPLTLDVQLTALPPQPLSLEATQVVGTSTPVSFTFGPMTTTSPGGGAHTTTINYSATRDLGAFNAEATYGTDDASLSISDIPHSIVVSVNFGDGTDTVNVNMTHGISDITASYRHVGDISFDASVHLNTVPSSISLQLGRSTSNPASGPEAGGTVTTPDFSYTASAAGLNITAYADASLEQPIDATAAFQLMVNGIGSSVTATLNGTDLHITSSPATASFLLTAEADLDFNVSLNFNCCDGVFNNTGNLHVNANISQFNIGFTGMSSLDLNLGITTGLEGNYSQFTLSENSDTKIDINDVFQGCIPFPDPVGTQCVNLITINPTSIDLMNVIAGFHYDQDQEGNVFSIPVLEFGLAHCGVNITANPSSAGDSSGPNIVLGPPPPGQDNLPAAWLITPNPNLMGFSLPDFALDTIAFFESPYGNHIGANFGCDWGP